MALSSVICSKLKIVIIQLIKSRIWDTIDDCFINNLAKNQVTAVFYSPVIRRSGRGLNSFSPLRSTYSNTLKGTAKAQAADF